MVLHFKMWEESGSPFPLPPETSLLNLTYIHMFFKKDVQMYRRNTPMRIYVICPVRNADAGLTDAIRDYVEQLEKAGHEVHFPPRDVDQNDATGMGICSHHLAAIQLADRVDVYWDVKSSGSHFDLGMAYALGKEVNLVHLCEPDGPGKSYVKVMQQMKGGNYSPEPGKKAFCNRNGKPDSETSLSRRFPPPSPKL